MCGRIGGSVCEGKPGPGSSGRVSTRRRPVRRVESGHPRRRRTGLSDACLGGEPADAVLNTAAWQGGRCAPLRPPACRADADVDSPSPGNALTIPAAGPITALGRK